ncbi:hypothetical protein KWG64_06360 [Rahnella sp. PD12R]|uniref:hypothetical protein n=1 Tax=Rahnella sp. PD12R TaxID=2855688 RepID=UPI001C484F2A|nr:hypothetical protein [Rahnella sp. PD12R]MBV6817563.1 hypothetical protein [Rahnella sp. PD12R]
MTDTTDIKALRESAESIMNLLDNLAGFDPQDIDMDAVELRFEDENGFDAGCDISIVDTAQQSADIIRALLDQFEAERQRADVNEPVHCEGVPQHVHDMIDLKETIDELRAELAALKEKHAALRESMAAIHNTIRGSGGHVSLSVLLAASEKAWRDSAPIENSVKEKNCDKCGGSGSYHCPQMLGTVECECGIVKDGE